MHYSAIFVNISYNVKLIVNYFHFKETKISQNESGFYYITSNSAYWLMYFLLYSYKVFSIRLTKKFIKLLAQKRIKQNIFRAKTI